MSDASFRLGVGTSYTAARQGPGPAWRGDRLPDMFPSKFSARRSLGELPHPGWQAGTVARRVRVRPHAEVTASEIWGAVGNVSAENMAFLVHLLPLLQGFEKRHEHQSAILGKLAAGPTDNGEPQSPRMVGPGREGTGTSKSKAKQSKAGSCHAMPCHATPRPNQTKPPRTPAFQLPSPGPSLTQAPVRPPKLLRIAPWPAAPPPRAENLGTPRKGA